jgi:hypothetical protein
VHCVGKIEIRAIPFIVADDAPAPAPEEGEREAWDGSARSLREGSFFYLNRP